MKILWRIWLFVERSLDLRPYDLLLHVPQLVIVVGIDNNEDQADDRRSTDALFHDQSSIAGDSRSE